VKSTHAPHPWLAVLSLALGSFANITAEFLPVGVLPQIIEAFNISAGSAGLMMTMPGILAALAAPGIMLVAGRTDRRHILLLLSATLLASCLLCAWAPTYWIMLIGRSMVGLSLGAFWAMGLSVAVRLVAQNVAHKAAAFVFAGVTAAMVLGVPFGTLVAEYTSWRGAFLAIGGIAAVALGAQIWMLPSVPSETALRFSSLTRFIQQPAARKSLLMVTLIFAAHFGTYTYVAPLMRQANIASSNITWVLLGYGVTGFIANFVASHFIAQHLRGSLQVAKILLLIPLLALPWLLASPSTTIALILLWGVAWGALPLCLNTWHRQETGADAEASAGMFTFTVNTAIALGAALGGVIVDHSGLSATFQTGAAVVLLSIVLLTRTPRANHPL